MTLTLLSSGDTLVDERDIVHVAGWVMLPQFIWWRPNPSSSNMTLYGSRVNAYILSQDKFIRMSLDPRWQKLMERRNLWTQREMHRGKTVWRDTRRRWPPTNQGERPGKHPSPTIFRRNQPCQRIDLRLLASRAVSQCISMIWVTHFMVPLVN